MRRRVCLTALSLLTALTACHPAGTKPPSAAITTTDATRAAPTLVGLTATLDRGSLPPDTTTRVVAQLRLDAGAVAPVARPPVDLALVIDTSGSMIGEPIAQARDAAIAMLDGLRAGDRITVVTFDTRVQVLVAPTVVGPQTSANIAKQLQQMQARGTTDLAAGLATALQQVATTPLAGSAARIVVLGDGVPNDATTIPQLVAQAAASKIAISALGLGLEYDETLLAQLARGTGGRFHRIAKDETIAAAFRDEVFHIESVIASNLLLQLHPGPGVNIVRVIGHATAPDHTRAHAVRLTDLSAGQQQDIFVELEVSAHAEGAPVELLDAIASYDDHAANAGHLEQRTYVAAEATIEHAHERNLEVERAAASARAAAATVDAIAQSRVGDFAGADTLLRETEAVVRATAKDTGDTALTHSADELAGLRKTLASERKRYEKALAEAEREAKRHAGGTVGAKAPTPAPHAAMPEPDRDQIRRVHDDALATIQPR